MRFWVYDPGKRAARGPFEIADLKRLPALSPDMTVAPEGAVGPGAWRPAKTYDELRVLFVKPPPPPTARSAPPPMPPGPPSLSPETAALARSASEPLGFTRSMTSMLMGNKVAIAVIATMVSGVGYGLFSVKGVSGPEAPGSVRQPLDIQVKKIEFPNALLDRGQVHPRPKEGNTWCLVTFVVKTLGSGTAYSPEELRLVDDQETAYDYARGISLFRSLQESPFVSPGLGREGQLPYQIPKAARVSYFLYDGHGRSPLKILIPTEIAKQVREDERKRDEEEVLRQKEEAKRVVAELRATMRSAEADARAKKLRGSSIDYPTFFAKAKGTGLPIGKRYTFQATVSHNFCLSDPSGDRLDHLMCVTSQVDEDNSERLEQFLKGPDRQILNVTAAMLEGGFGAAVTILRLE